MKLKNKTVVILGTAKYDGIYESTSYTTAKFLAISNDVYYVDPPYTFKDYYKERGTLGFETRRPYFSRKSMDVISTDIPRLKIVITPPLLSINFLPEGILYRYLLQINESRIARRIIAVLNANHISDFVYINSFNFHYPQVDKKINPTLSIYQCVDPLIIDYDRKHGLISEKIISKTADMIVCTSMQLYREKLSLNRNTFFIPNAADIEHSSEALNPELPVHGSLINIPKPIIGYFGHIERRMDFPMLETVILDNQDKSFVFVGPVSEEFIPLGFRAIKNVYFTGRMPFKEMPSIIKGFDIAIIPFKKDAVSSTIFPLKLFEYLGTGKPVIATDFNSDLENFTGDVVTYTSNAADFSTAIEFYLQHDDEHRKQRRLQIAAENTWSTRIDQLAELIYKFYKEKLS